MDKPREFWIINGLNGCEFDHSLPIETPNSTHVIEYSAYESLQQQLALETRRANTWFERAESAQTGLDRLEQQIADKDKTIAVLREALKRECSCTGEVRHIEPYTEILCDACEALKETEGK